MRASGVSLGYLQTDKIICGEALRQDYVCHG